MSGEVTDTSVILQARLTVDGELRFNDIKGRPGIGYFELSLTEDFDDSIRTEVLTATEEMDFILKTQFNGLEPGTRYFYRLISGERGEALTPGPIGTFQTLSGFAEGQRVRIAAVTGMNRFAFRAGIVPGRDLGFPALQAILDTGANYLVATGDNVYYDVPYFNRAKTLEDMRAKWHRQFVTPRFQELFLNLAVYWQKDDHDYRYNDADPYGDLEPSPDLGWRVFREQVPVVPEIEADAVTYRTYRVNQSLQIWLLESRDHRDSNVMEPGPEKSLWGEEQREWLQSTLLESDATFKLIFTPTAMVGPDDLYTGVQGGILSPIFGGAPVGQEGDARRRDSHTTPYGFQDEALDFFAWLAENAFGDQQVFLICGDRHWQYHSIHPSGYEEFSVGAIIDRNSRLGPKPGEPDSTDEGGLIQQPYLQAEASGGFLLISLDPGQADDPVIEFAFYDEQGELLYQVVKNGGG
jgi:alkaline phosphatase/alkaline phosphatase D